MNIEKLSNLFGAETANKIYEDTISPSAKEAGQILADFIKAARLFTAPIQLAASYQKRLSDYFERVNASVPQKNQIPAPPSLSGPIIDKLKYLEETNYLTNLYLNLLSRAIDKERVNEAHPAFLHIIDQSSPDEAIILYKLKDKSWKLKDKNLAKYTDFIQENNAMLKDVSMEGLTFPKNFQMYALHLQSLGLIQFKTAKLHYPFAGNKAVKYQFEYVEDMHLTQFGRLFVKACIPSEGFTIPTS